MLRPVFEESRGVIDVVLHKRWCELFKRLLACINSNNQYAHWHLKYIWVDIKQYGLSFKARRRNASPFP